VDAGTDNEAIQQVAGDLARIAAHMRGAESETRRALAAAAVR